jgi:hypothetical protein
MCACSAVKVLSRSRDRTNESAELWVLWGVSGWSSVQPMTAAPGFGGASSTTIVYYVLARSEGCCAPVEEHHQHIVLQRSLGSVVRDYPS